MAEFGDGVEPLDEAGRFSVVPGPRARVPAPATMTAQVDRPTTTLSTAVGEQDAELDAPASGKRNLVIVVAGIGGTEPH